MKERPTDKGVFRLSESESKSDVALWDCIDLYQYHTDQVKVKAKVKSLSLSTESLWYPFLEYIRFVLYWVHVIKAVFSLYFSIL